MKKSVLLLINIAQGNMNLKSFQEQRDFDDSFYMLSF